MRKLLEEYKKQVNLFYKEISRCPVGYSWLIIGFAIVMGIFIALFLVTENSKDIIFTFLMTILLYVVYTIGNHVTSYTRKYWFHKPNIPHMRLLIVEVLLALLVWGIAFFSAYIRELKQIDTVS